MEIASRLVSICVCGNCKICRPECRYIIRSPLFEKLTVNVGNSKSFTILAPNTSERNIYVQSVKLNGSDYHQTFITHQDIMKGGTLEFAMGPGPNRKWFTRE